MKVRVNGIYRHYKGDLYLIVDVARHSETLEEMVIYRGLYENAPLWVRPMELFVAKLDPAKQRVGLEQEWVFEPQEIESKR
ncbi:DUF1653 domain-containing protein [Candidatus Saccharibacteria bacterium]|nr:DUF1653 domain-containing protein [Candidatus Saccharibacteria bacterium]